MQRSFCLRICKWCTASAVHIFSYMLQRGVFVSQLILFMAFGDASDMMSSTSLYAFLVSIINADSGDFKQERITYQHEMEILCHTELG